MPLDSAARRFRAVLGPAMVLSLALHAALLAAWRSVPSDGTARPGRGAPGSTEPVRPLEDALEVVHLAAPPPPIVVPPPPATAKVRRAEVREPGIPVASGPAAGALHPVALARPASGVKGAGEREGAGEGGGGLSPPVPLSVLPVWEPPEEIRGREFRVRVHVGVDGRPTGPLELEPRTGVASFDRRLIEKVRAMRFRPARTADGRPVAAWAELTFGF